MNQTRRWIFAAAVLAAGLVAAYRTMVRPRALRWGATRDVVARPLPGDLIVRKADFVATGAITIDAAPGQAWPWLVQIGSGRAGWNSYDRVDNADRPSATAIIPELHHPQVGDLVPMVAGKDVGVWVKELEPGRRMLWWDRKGEYTWGWLLGPEGGRTRLINRVRVTRHPWTRRMLYELVAANGDIVMMRKMLRGIKKRAECLTAGQPAPAADTAAS